jgi:hypothetical protein
MTNHAKPKSKKKQPGADQKKAKSNRANKAHKDAKKPHEKKGDDKQKQGQGQGQPETPKVKPDAAKGATKVGATTAKCAALAKPCHGLGLDSDKKRKAYIKDFKQLQKDWKKLSRDEKKTRLAAAASKQLAPDSHDVKVDGSSKIRSGQAHYDFDSNTLVVSDEVLDKKELSDAEAKGLASDLYHESRHAEQWNLMARKLASEGKTPKEIAKAVNVTPEVAEAAKANPLPKDCAAQQCAQAIYDSVYGANSAHREETLTKEGEAMSNTRKASEESNDAAKHSEAVNKDPKSSAEDKKKAFDDWKAKYKAYQDAEKISDPLYKAYKELPEEADAWEQGDKINASW